MAEMLGIAASTIGLLQALRKTAAFLLENGKVSRQPVSLQDVLFRLEFSIRNASLLVESIPKLNLSPSWSRETLLDLEPVVRDLMKLAEVLSNQFPGSNFSLKKRMKWATTEARTTQNLHDIEKRLAAIRFALPGAILLNETTTSKVRQIVASSSQSAETDKYGLKVIWESNSISSIVINKADVFGVVLIHGLNASSTTTWGAVDKFWPRDLLPQSFPQARIMTYDYDSRVSMSSSRSNQLNAEKTLVYSVVDECRKQDSPQRLIFCAHSFGGILLQKAVAYCCKTSSIETSSREFLSAAKGFIFLGTPHFGNRTTSFENFFEKLAPLAPRKDLSSFAPSLESVINDLNVFSSFSRDEKLPVFSFYESQPTTTPSGPVRIVTPERELNTDEPFFLNGNHSSMCRFQTPKDDGYIKVEKVIQQMARTGSGSETPFERLSQKSIEKMDLLRPLKVDHGWRPDSHTLIQAQQDYSEKRRRFILQLRERIPAKRPTSDCLSGSCEWIRNTEQFTTWRSEKGPLCFVILGEPGSGRTKMIEYLVEVFKRTAFNNQNPKFDRSRLTLSYFCDWRRPSGNQALMWLNDILLQLVEADVSLFKEIYRKLEMPPTTYSDLEALVLRLLQTSSLREIDLIIDGLDECDLQSLALIQRTTTELMTWNARKIRVLMTTDNSANIPRAIDDQSQYFILDSYVAQRNKEIQLFIEHRLLWSPSRYRYSAELLADLSRELYRKAAIRPIADVKFSICKANSSSDRVSISESESTTDSDETCEGCFIWLSLAINIIETEQSASNMKKTLDGLPRKLSPLYDMVLGRIPKQDQGFIVRVLHFIICALRPLETKALAFALALNERQTTTQEVLEEQIIDLQTSLTTFTGSLVVFDNDSVSLSHQRLLRHLRDTESTSLPLLNVEESDSDIATACLRCLMLHDTMDDMKPSEIPFIAYSERYWFEHVKRSPDVDGELRDLLISFVSSGKLVVWLKRSRLTALDILLPESSHSHHILAALDLLNNKEILDRLPQTEYVDPQSQKVDILDSQGRTPLHYAIANNASNSIKFLMDQGSDCGIVDNSGWSCPHMAVYSGNVNLIRRFSNQGPMDPSLLNLAIERRHWNVADRLLERVSSIPGGVNNDNTEKDWRKWKGRGGRGIIHQAVLSRQEAMVDKLRVKDVMLDLTDDNGMNALHLAAKLAECGIVRALIASNLVKKQFSIDATDLKGNTALHLAAETGDIEVVKLLAQHDATYEHINKSGELPLHLAAMYGYENIVDLLLAMGSRVNTDDNHASPLHMASAWGWHRVARKLIRAGANIESKDEKGRTPLYLAAYNGSRIMVDLLLRYKASPSTADAEKRTPLHVAALGGWEPVVRLLLKNDVMVNAKTKDLQQTPLHFAALSENPSDGLVKRVLDAGANIEQEDKTGKTAFQLAQDSENTLIAELLSKAQQVQNNLSAPSWDRQTSIHSVDRLYSASRMEVIEDVENRQRQDRLDILSNLQGEGHQELEMYV